jgi:hypothetical protein
MSIDSIYEIGSSHLVCQDYCRANIYKDISYAIVSDGCSTANDTDVGARLLVLESEKIIKILDCVGMENFKNVVEIEEFFKEALIKAIRSLQSENLLDSNAFAATLLIALCWQDNTYVFGWGDGVIACKIEDQLEIIKIDYESGAPFYLNYLVSEQRTEKYKNTFPGCVKHSYTLAKMDDEFSFKQPFIYQRKNVQQITLMSDGINSFRYSNKHPDYNKRCVGINYEEMVERILDFKQTQGDFLKRKIQFLKKKFDLEYIEHYDDVCLASIIIK